MDNVVSAVYGGNISISSPQISCSNSLNFGAVSVIEACEKAYTIRNYGSAPLTISRIVFDSEALSIKESLPMVIPASGNTNITVAYSSVEQAAFDATMQIYSNDPDLRMKNVAVSGSRFAPNFMTASAANVITSQDVRLDLSIDNYDPIIGLQFDVVCPTAYQGSTDFQVEARAEGMTVTAIQTGTNTWQYYCYFLSGGGIAAGSGKVMTLVMKPVGGSAPVGSYTFEIKNVKMGTADMLNKYAGDNLQCNVTVNEVIMGDVNGDGEVDIADAVCIVNHIVSKPTQVFIEAAANVNNDNDIDIADAVRIVNLIVGKIQALARRTDMTLPEPE